MANYYNRYMENNNNILPNKDFTDFEKREEAEI